MAYLNGKKLLFGAQLHLVDGYDIGHADGYEEGYEKGTTERNAVMGSIIDRSIAELPVECLSDSSKIGDYAFYRCKSLASVTIPGNIESIGEHAFAQCSSLSTASIEGGTKTIGSMAFYYAPLTYVKLEEGVEQIRYCAFGECTKLTNLIVPSSVISMDSGALRIGLGTNRATITMLGETPATIQSDTFSEFRLEEIVVPVNSIDAYLTATNWSNFADYIIFILTAEDFAGVEILDDYAYATHEHLGRVEIAESVTTIGHYAFKNCTMLKSVSIPDSVIGIGKQCFYGCVSLESVVLPPNIVSIRGGTFYRCKSLKSVSIPEGVKLIAGNSFNFCDSLTELEIPSSVTKIEEEALLIGSASEKATITILAQKPPTLNATAFNTDYLEKIVVPLGCGSAYKKATNWSALADYIEEAET